MKFERISNEFVPYTPDFDAKLHIIEKTEGLEDDPEKMKKLKRIIDGAIEGFDDGKNTVVRGEDGKLYEYYENVFLCFYREIKGLAE